MKVHEFARLESKLKLKTRNAGDRLAWFEYQGRVITRTKRSHGNKDLPEHLIRQQLKVNEYQFSALIGCSLRLQDYVEILRKKGLIEALPPGRLEVHARQAFQRKTEEPRGSDDRIKIREQGVLNVASKCSICHSWGCTSKQGPLHPSVQLGRTASELTKAAVKQPELVSVLYTDCLSCGRYAIGEIADKALSDTSRWTDLERAKLIAMVKREIQAGRILCIVSVDDLTAIIADSTLDEKAHEWLQQHKDWLTQNITTNAQKMVPLKKESQD